MGNRYLVDENGVVIRTISDEQFLQIKKQGTPTGWDSSVEIKYHFTKINAKGFGYCAKKYSLFLDIVPYATFLDNALVFNNGVPLKTTNMKNVTKLSYKSIQTQLREMIKEDIIQKMVLFNNEVYVLNPWLCMRGKRINRQVYEAFEQSIWRTQSKERGVKDETEA